MSKGSSLRQRIKKSALMRHKILWTGLYSFHSITTPSGASHTVPDVLMRFLFSTDDRFFRSTELMLSVNPSL